MSATKKLMESTAILAAQQGAAGDFLSKLLNNTFGAGAAEFTEQGKALIEAGMGDLASGMNELSRGTMSQADTIKFLDRFKDEVAANSDTLRMLAVSGNAGAQTILEVAGNIKKMSIADLARAKDQAQTTDKMSKFFLNLESVWGNVVGAFQKGLLSGIEPIMRAVNGLIGDEGMGGLSAKAEEFGKSVGEMLTKIFTKENIEQAGVVLNMFWEVAKAAGQFMLNMINEITKFDGAIKTLSLGFFNLGTVVKILIGAMLLSKGLKMAGAVGGAIKTAHTLITGGEVAAGGIGALFTGRGAAAAAGTLVGGETAAAGGAGILGKLGVLGKFGKAIPILGGILGAVDAIDRFKKGDFLGAGISAAGGAASFIPGLGGIVGAAGSYAANTYLDSRKAEPTETTQRAQMDAATKSASDAASGAAQSGSDSDKDASTDDLNKLTQQQLAVSANTRDVLGNKLDNIARLLANMNT
jgi:hypothetical protein